MTRNYFQFADGGRLSWYETGNGPPLVMLHGWSISADAFAEIAELLSSDYRLLIPDLPGHGVSSPAPTNDIAGLSAGLVTWMNAILDGPVILAGWSLGGMVSIEIARSRAIAVDKLALIGTTPRFTNCEGWDHGLPATQVHALSRNLKRRFEVTLGEFFSLSLAGEALTSERLRTIRNFAVRSSRLPDKRVALSLLEHLAVQDQRDDLAAIDCPVVVMHGEADQVSPVAAGRALAAAVPDAKMIEFAGVGHAPFWSKPEAFVDCLREYC